jgi:ubiquinone/menaquinone biosynthesis C-methylase UbiE
MKDFAEKISVNVVWCAIFVSASVIQLLYQCNLWSASTGKSIASTSEDKKKVADDLSSWLRFKYNMIAYVYDLFDYPWEVTVYRDMRHRFTADMQGSVMELGVGTGRNISHYESNVLLTAVDISSEMLSRAKQASSDKNVKCRDVVFMVADATQMDGLIVPGSMDWTLATFLFCVLPDEIQPLAVRSMHDALKTGGRFRIVELQYSAHNISVRNRQKWFAPFVEWIYGARFDRRTLEHVNKMTGLVVTNVSYLTEGDTHLLIEGERVD